MDDEDFCATTDDMVEMVENVVGGAPKERDLPRVEERAASHNGGERSSVGVGVGLGASVEEGGLGARPPSPTGEEETKGHSFLAARPPSPPPSPPSSPNEISV